MSYYRATGKELPRSVWILVLVASVLTACALDHFVIRPRVPSLHGLGTVRVSFGIGTAKLNVPGEWGILVTWLLPFLTAAILAFPFGKGCEKRVQAYWPRLIKVACIFVALPLGLVLCAIISPLIELIHIPIDYFSIGVHLSTWGYELGEFESSLILFPVLSYVLYRLGMLFLWKRRA
jgi:hypothetical protein